MKLRLACIMLSALAMVVVAPVDRIHALGTAFTYQGQLLLDGSPTTGACDVQFTLFDAASGGNQTGSTQTVSPLSATNGLFTVELNEAGQFGGSAFTGSDRWLQIAVRCPVGSGNYTTLTPRQPLTATPYALFAPSAGSANSLACSGCVNTANLAANAVTDQTIANGISYGKLVGAPSALPPNGPAGGSLNGMYPNPGIGAAAVGTAQLQDNAVTGAKIADGTITGADIAGATIAGSNIANGTVTGANVADGSLTTADIDFTTGNINFANSTAGVGNVLKNGNPFIHNFGSENTFVGVNAGNFSMSGNQNATLGAFTLNANTTGVQNTALGYQALKSNTTGAVNTAVGHSALASNTTGGGNTAVGLVALSSNTTAGANTAVGYQALTANITGHDNSALGSQALAANTIGNFNVSVGGLALAFNTTGSSNTAVGFGALNVSTTGSDNQAFGTRALSFNTTGAKNIAVGEGALFNNTTGNTNTAVGDGALSANTTASNNAALGSQALAGNTIGSQNIAIGAATLNANTTGGLNTAVGDQALHDNTTASGNIAVGASALHANTGGINVAIGLAALASNTTGVNNIALGSLAGSSLTTGSNNIDVGNLGVAGESNTTRIGIVGTQTATFIAGISGATSSSGVAVYVNSGGQLGTTTSSARFKDDIEDMGDSTSNLMKLRPVRFRYKKDIDPAGLEQYGLVAEEVAKVYPDLVVYDDQGQPQTVRYHFVNAMLLNEVQKQARQIAEQTALIAEQQRQYAALAARLQHVETTMGALGQMPATRAVADPSGVPHLRAKAF